MVFWVGMAGVPLGLFFLLVALPRGRPAFLGCALAGLVIGLLWAGYFLDLDLLRDTEFQRRGHLMVALVALSLSWAVAGSLQALRLRLPGSWPAWVWPVLVMATFLTVIAAILRMIGL